MDGETIRLIVVALGAIIAGLSGSLIAGAFNSQNTQATIEAARQAAQEQREADAETEQTRWLRDRLVQSYAKFLRQVQDLNNTLHDVHEEDDAADPSRLPESMATLAGDELMLIAPKPVKAAVGEVMMAVRQLAFLNATVSDAKERKSQFEAASDDLASKYQKLARLMREDLGTDEISSK